MIVPRNKLLFWTALVVVPFAGIATALPAAAPLAGLVLTGFVVIVLADAWRGRGLLADVGIELPAVVRMTRQREGSLEIRITNPTQRPRQLRLGLALPATVAAAQEDLRTQLPAGAAVSRVRWKCTPAERGRYVVPTCHVESASPWGFWAVRAARPVNAELRVYPNLAGERRQLAALFLRRGNFGVHAHRQVGQGREFEKLREYLHGDPVADIHWKATAKRGRPVTKVFQIEKTQEVYVAVDASRLSARAGVLERYVTAALTLALAAEQHGDLFGLVTFSDRVQSFVRARSGSAHFNACRDALYTLTAQTVAPDFDGLCSFLRLRLRRRALLVILTSLDDPVLAENFTRHVELISRQHVVLVNMVEPPGARPLFAPGSEVARVDELYQRLGGHLRWHGLRELERVLGRRGVGLSQSREERLAAGLVTEYLNVKRRQLL